MTGIWSSHVDLINDTNNTCVWKDHIESVQKNPHRLKNVPNYLRVKELCMIAVLQEGSTIQYVPENIIDQHMCDVALNNNNSAIPYIPIRFLTADICFQIIKKEWVCAASIPFKKMPNEFQNELLNLILDCDVSFLKGVYLKKRNKVNCLDFLLGKIDNIDYLNEDVLIKLIQQNIYILNKLSDVYLDSLKIEKIMIEKTTNFLMDGKTFNELYSQISFMKLTQLPEIHNGLEFVDGLNEDKKEFNPKILCGGGIYFTISDMIGNFYNYNNKSMVYKRKVLIPDDAQVLIEPNYKIKTDKMILGKREKIFN